MKRRSFLRKSAQVSLGLSALGLTYACSSSTEPSTRASAPTDQEAATDKEVAKWFDISLAQWSLHQAFRKGDLDTLDFARIARQEYGLGGIEYVSQLFKEKAKDKSFFQELNKHAADEGVKQLLIMIDGEGNLGSTDKQERLQAVENHYKWVDNAKLLGCHSIRVNAAGEGTREEVAKAATHGLATLGEYAKDAGLNILVENHGGYSSDGQWLASVIKNTGMDNCGTLPDFGNFCIERNPGGWEAGCKTEYDRYQGVRELMPYAKAVSAKSYDFDKRGEVIETEYPKMLEIVKDAGYNGWIGIEYEGTTTSPEEGIRKTKAVLEHNGGRVAKK